MACLCVCATSSDRAFDSGERLWKNSGLIMPLMIDGPDQLQEWLDWTWPRHNAFLACWKPTRNTEPECLSAALLAPLTEWCLLQCTTVLQEDYVRRSRIAGQKMCFSRNCFSLSKIPGQNFGAVSSAVVVNLCAHLWLSSLLSYPVSESEKISHISIQNHNGCIKKNCIQHILLSSDLCLMYLAINPSSTQSRIMHVYVYV